MIGHGCIATGPIVSALDWAYSSDVDQSPRDLARANALLDQTGYPRRTDGLRFAVRVPYGAAAFDPVAQVVGQDLFLWGPTVAERAWRAAPA